MLSNQWLQNKSFIQWRLFPSEEDNLYWEKFIQETHISKMNRRSYKDIKINKIEYSKNFLQKRNRKYLH